MWSELAPVIALLAAATALGMAFQRLRQSAVLGYMLAGILFGPGATGWLRWGDLVSGMAEVGVALLLFTVGLEFPFKRLRSMGASGLGGTGLQLAATAVLGSGGFLLAGFPARQAVVLGMMVGPSATALMLRLFVERAEADAVHARTASVITILQGAFDVPILIAITAAAGGRPAEGVLPGIGRAVGFLAVLVAVLFAFCVFLLPRALRIAALTRNREFPILLAVVTCSASSLAAHALGVSPALGAFVAGALLAESPFSTQVRADVQSLKTLFSTVFFASFGILVDAGWGAAHLPAVLALTGAIVAGKALITWPILRVFGLSLGNALAAGVCLATLDEFSLVIAQVGRSLDVFPDETFQLIVSSVLLTLVLTPFLLAAAPRLGAMAERGFARLGFTRAPETSFSPAGRPLKDHVIVVGYGPAGRGVTEALRAAGAEAVVCELNPVSVARAREEGFRAEVGDASSEEVLEHLRVDTACALVLAVPDRRAALQVLRQARAMAPEVEIVARARHHRHVEDFEAAGAHAVVDEEVEIGKVLGAEAVRCSGRRGGATAA